MKDKDIKKVLEQIKSDESMKTRILENVYEKLNTSNYSEENKFKTIYFKNKKSISILVASIVLVCGVLLQNKPSSRQPLNAMDSPSSRELTNDEFNHFDVQDLKYNTEKIEIKNHQNTDIFKEITDKSFINDTLESIENAKEIDIKYGDYTNEEERQKAYKVLEDIGKSQGMGNSITMNFIKKDDSISSIRLNLDLDIICLNEKYYYVSSSMVKNIEKELKTVEDFKQVNIPGKN